MKKLLLFALLVTGWSNSFAYLSQGHWRWRNNDGTENSATWKAGQDTSVIISDNKAIRLRIDIVNGQNATKGYAGVLEYATSLKGTWKTISSATINNAFVLAGNNSYITDNSPTTQQITEPGSTFGPGKIFTLSSDHNDSVIVKQRKEYEWCIKPTSFIAPNTKYYFRPSLGSGQITNVPNLTTSANFAGPKIILSNGSFLQGLTDWTNIDNNGGNTFSVTDTGLLVHVTKQGQANSLQTAHKAFKTVPGRIYLVRFYGYAHVNPSGLVLNLQNSKGTKTVKFRIFPYWQHFQYAFKAADTTMSIHFNYQTPTDYVMNNITVQDENDPVDDVPMTYMWQNNRSGYGWLSGDGQESLGLPDGRSAWFFSDSWMGTNDTTTNFVSTSLLINNVLVVQDGKAPNGRLTTYGGANNTALVLPVTSVGAQSWYWPRDAVMENNNIKILMPEYDRPTANADVVFANVEAVATISYPDFKVTKVENLPFLGNTQWSVLLKGDADGQYSYVYGATNDFPEGKALVARYPKDQLNAATSWDFLSDAGWVKDYTKAKVIAPYYFGTVMRLDTNNYVAVFMPSLSNSIDAMYATSPTGPWVNHTVLCQVPGLANGLDYFAYLHKETGVNGVYSISYSDNATIPIMLDDKDTYQPHWIKADLKGLSPFTKKKSADSVFTFTAKALTSTIQLNWAAAQTNDNHFELQRTIDGVNWQLITAVAGNNSVSAGNYQAVDPSPYNGKNYYRLVMYDIDNKQSFSPTISVTPKDALVGYSASVLNKIVTLNYTTALKGHNHYLIQYSFDNISWNNSPNIPGDNNTAHSINFAYPPPGTYYLRMALFGPADVMTLTPSAKLTIPAINTSSLQSPAETGALNFIVYPNPANANVSFGLSGYQGKTFTVTLSNLYGKQIGKQTFTVNSAGQYTLATHAASGTYLINIDGENLAKSSRVIVQ